jgi:hypothetical protein
VDFDATGQILIIYSAFIKYLRRKLEYSETVHQIFIDFKKAYDSVRRKVCTGCSRGNACFSNG